jgi:membrane fusion protein, multidrug efflux system
MRTQPAQSNNEGNALGTQDDAGRRQEPRQKHGIFKTIIFTTAILAIGIGLVAWWLNSRKFEGTDDAYVAGHIHAMSFRVSGTISEVLIDDNELVKVEQRIAILDPRDFEVQLNQATAKLEIARAQLEQSEAQLAQAVAQLQQTQAQADAAQAKLSDSQRLYERNKQLFDSGGAISRQDFDNSKFQFQQDQASFNSANAAVRVSQANLQATKAQRASALAQIHAATESVENAKLQLSYTTLYAPTAGHIANKTLEAGQRVQPGQTVVAVVEPSVWIVANLKETQLGRIRPGQSVEISVDAIQGRKFTGKVDSFQTGTGAVFALLPPDNATGNFTKIVQRVPVKIVFDRQSIQGYEDRIVPGLSTVPSIRVE